MPQNTFFPSSVAHSHFDYFVEFRMSYQSDSVRKTQLLALLTEKGHPFGKFLWGE